MSLALYRRYRPETFAEVIGQDHVTGPLQQAIRNDRVHHAYLFSGPHGCGKTTSARLLARCLNCEQGPTPEPCGECQSCRDLSRGGAGSIDVVEIDAASHGGVDDARDLRERAFFAPAVSRYKIYIIDEAHMVTMAGFNALLKVVEEPPPHLKFVFATTEPDKVIPTIRSRTHHYPFRLVPPSIMRDYLASLCEQEGVAVEPAVLSLVVRAGAGSVRDGLSVLDQLIAGADESGVTYALATSLLGFTDAQLLDDVVDAFAAGDGAGVFRVVERVIDGGHDPRRFAQDLLERLRDLVILSAVADAESSGLIDAPADQLERMRQQAGRLGSGELTRAADIVNAGLTEMRGATAPRLQLELICARILLPGADDGERGLPARIDRLERLLSVGAAPDTSSAGSTGAPDTPAPASGAPEARGSGTQRRARAVSRSGTASPTAGVAEGDAGVKRAAGGTRAAASGQGDTTGADGRVVGAGSRAAEPAVRAAPPGDVAPAGLDLAGVRRMWPDILEVVKARRRFTWLLLLDHVQVVGLADGVLTVAFANEGQRKNFAAGGSDEILRAAIHEVLGADWGIEAVLDPGRADPAGVDTPRAGGRRGGSSPQSHGSEGTGAPAASGGAEAAGGGQSEGGPPSGAGPSAARSRSAKPSEGDRPDPAAGTASDASPVPPQRMEGTPDPDVGDAGAVQGGASRRAVGRTVRGRAAAVRDRGSSRTGAADDPDAHAHPDDEDLDDTGLAGAELLAKELGATLIDEIDRQD